MYVVVTDCQWRQLPGDLPYWKTTYNYFRKWSKSKLWILIELELNQLVILKEDRNKTPSVLIVDS
jgi:transposase